MKKSYTFLIIPDEARPITRFRIPFIVVYSAMCILFILFITIFTIIYWMHHHSAEQSREFQRELTTQHHQFQTALQMRNQEIDALQHQIVQLSDQAQTTQTMLKQIVQTEKELAALAHLENPADDHNVQIQSFQTMTTSDEPIQTKFKKLGQQTEQQFQQLQQHMTIVQTHLTSDKQTLKAEQHLRAITPSYWPTLSRVITSPFGYRKDPFTGKISFHDGVDIGGKINDPVYAAADGTVIQTGVNPTEGNFIVIDHSHGIVSYFFHLHRILVRTHDVVKKGELIGRMGSTGRSTGPHLHYEIKKDGQIVNPILYLNHP